MLATQVDGALEDLLQATRALESLAGTRRPRVDMHLAQEIQTRKEALSALRARIDGDAAPDACWRELRRWRARSTEVLEQCFAYIEGALTREHAIAAELCELADGLLDDLSERSLVPWSRFTVLASSEYTDRLARVVRLRFPEVSVWSLPIAAHEFGHQVFRRLPADALEEARAAAALPNTPSGADYFEEYFADAFATWATGPAYLACCVCLRFDAGAAEEDERRHPGALKRAHLMLSLLAAMGEEASAAAQDMGARWTATLVTAGAALTTPDAGSRAQLDALAGAFAELLADALPEAVRYDGWNRRAELRAALADDGATLPAGARAWDVIAAAWTLRMAAGADGPLPAQDALYRARDLGARACRLCFEALHAIPSGAP